MDFNILFFTNSILLGLGLAMDAFSVSVTNGLNEAHMKKVKMLAIAGVFAFFQFIMPMAGWFLVHSFIEYFNAFEKFIPAIALIMLLYIGIKMILEGKCEGEECAIYKLTFGTLILQGIATSIDALSVGFTIADYMGYMAFICSLIVALTTFVVCFAGVIIGKRFGKILNNKAQILGGIILIIIGLEIFIKGIFF